MKSILVVFVLALLMMLLVGCTSGQKVAFESEPVKINQEKIPVDSTVSLSQALDQNKKAVQFGADDIDFLQYDRFLIYINKAKERDEIDRGI